MAVDEIDNTNAVLPTATLVSSRQRSPVPSAATPLNVPTPAIPAAAPQVLPPAQQAALLVNETLRALNFVNQSPADALLFNEMNPVVSAIVETQGLTPAQQTALLVNETLQTLNIAPSSASAALLIDETNPALAAALEAQDLPLTQQAALAINETLQDLGTATLAPANTIAAGPAAGAPSPMPGPLAATLFEATAAGVATAGETSGGRPPATTAAMPTALATTRPETAAASAALPTQSNAVQPILDRNPIAVPVYEVRDPTPAPSAPKPIRKDLSPSLPIGRVRPVDRLVLRQEWEKRKERGRRPTPSPRPSLTERSLQQMVNQANEDLTANGLPLRLVLAKNDEGYSLDIYDCSDETLCRLAQEVPLDLNHLLTTLDNIQHETGIIVNIKT